MEANLTNLEYETTYTYVAYVKTSEGETFYGEERTFTTPEAPTGIKTIGEETTTNSHIVNAYYNLRG